MHRLAIFVEGYTEILLVTELIQQVAGANQVHIDQLKIRGGTNAPRKMSVISASQPATGARYYVLLVDCGGDAQVKTRIVEEHDGLTKKNYWKIVGLRDVRPEFTHADIPKLEQGLRTRIKTALAPVDFVLAVMEVEAWFLAESTHFPRINAAITKAEIQARLGFDPENDDMSQRPTPTEDLNACYQIGGESYSKPALKTIAALDIDQFYLETAARCHFASRLIATIDAFLRQPPPVNAAVN